MVDYHFTDFLGVFGRANVMFSSRDPDGDLLASFTSTRTAIGVGFSVRWGRFRPFLGTGLEINFVGTVSASDSYWCKVSGGQPHFFDTGQECFTSDVSTQAPVTLVGPYLMPGVSVDIIGPLGVYLLGSFAFYINSSSKLDFPVGGEIGLEYRF